jgi:FecR-like protein
VTLAPCPRFFEVEAMRDGRLAGAELTTFARHMTTCAECAREVRALEALAESVRAGTDERASSNELRMWRERTRLLAAFDGTLLVPENWFRARRLLLPVTITAVIAGLLVISRTRVEPRDVRPVSADIRPEAHTVWTETIDGDRKKVVLTRGALRIHVDHSAGQGRFLVALPDGELEDRGTTFTVSAEDGHTTRVAVEEGSVVLRLRDRSSMTIRAGEAWIRETHIVSAEPTPPLVAAPAELRQTSPRPRAAVSSPPPSPAADSAVKDPTGDFRAAMSLLDAGANRRAAAGFAGFVEAHPRDPRAEDAAYLLVIAFQRSGSDDDARRAAQDYLKRYPAGFRRAEVEKLSR